MGSKYGRKPVILFASACGPFPKASLNRDDCDVFYYRNTLYQGLFQMRQDVNWHPLHLLAQNMPVASVVLENASWKRYEQELRRYEYNILALSFTVNLCGRILDMVRIARKIRPGIKIILGGYGTAIFSDDSEIAKELTAEVDGICRGEGVAYMRDFLLQHFDIKCQNSSIVQALLPSRNSLFRSRLTIIRQGHVIKSLGCQNGCTFCGTSHLFRKQKIDLADPASLYLAIRQVRDNYPDVGSIIIYDENFLKDKVFFGKFSQIISTDEDFMEHCSLTVFSSAEAVLAYDSIDLLKAGIGIVFIGVESFDKEILEDNALVKRQSAGIHGLFRDLEHVGIGSLASLILGWDGHTRESMKADLESFAALAPTFYQVVPLHAIPGTPLWNDMKSTGRIIPGYRLENDSVGRSNILHPTLSENELEEALHLAYKALVDEGGAWPNRVFSVNLRGLNYTKASTDPALMARARLYKRQISAVYPIAYAAAILFRGKGFMKRNKEDKQLFISLMPLQARFAPVFGIAILPILLLISLLGRFRHRLLPYGDQPPSRRYFYSGLGA